jgi:AMMECR1 domain-containing protein
MKITSATIATKSIKGIFPFEFTYEDGSKGIYLPENQMEYETNEPETVAIAARKGTYAEISKGLSYKKVFKTAQEVYEEVNKIVATKGVSGTI